MFNVSSGPVLTLNVVVYDLDSPSVKSPLFYFELLHIKEKSQPRNFIQLVQDFLLLV